MIRKSLILAVGAVVVAVGCNRAPEKLTPEAARAKGDELLKEMSKNLGALQTFAYTANEVREDTKTGAKVERKFTRRIVVRRPNSLAVTTTGDDRDAKAWYDGKHLTLVANNEKVWVRGPMPPTLDEALDFLSAEYAFQMPTADLLYSSPYDALMTPDTTGGWVDVQTIGNRQCDHVAYSQGIVDWELWLGDQRRLPCQARIVYKNEPGRPTVTVTFTEGDFVAADHRRHVRGQDSRRLPADQDRPSRHGGSSAPKPRRPIRPRASRRRRNHPSESRGVRHVQSNHALRAARGAPRLRFGWPLSPRACSWCWRASIFQPTAASGGSVRQSSNAKSNAGASRNNNYNRNTNDNRNTNVNRNTNTNTNVNRNANVNRNVNVNNNVNVNRNVNVNTGVGYGARPGGVVVGEEGAVAVGRRGAVAVGEEGYAGVGRYGAVVGGERYESYEGWRVAAGVATGIAIGTMLARPPTTSVTVVAGGSQLHVRRRRVLRAGRLRGTGLIPRRDGASRRHHHDVARRLHHDCDGRCLGAAVRPDLLPAGQQRLPGRGVLASGQMPARWPARDLDRPTVNSPPLRRRVLTLSPSPRRRLCAWRFRLLQPEG